MKRYCLTLDLKDDPALIAEYRRYHGAGQIWPEVSDALRKAGVLSSEIYLLGTRMVMVLETVDAFSFETKAAIDSASERVQDWERLMWKFQKPLPGSKPGEKWLLMEKIFELG
ncbi:MAG TPA: L-rhamnose mutarotase [Tepidisphaeraceae bacterium]